MGMVNYISTTPNIVLVEPEFINQWAASYFSKRRIEMREKISNYKPGFSVLAKLVTVSTNRIMPHNSINDIYIGLDSINSGTGEIKYTNHFESGISGNSCVIKKRDLIFSRLRPNLNKVAICPENIEKALGSTELLVMEAKDTIDSHYLFAALKSKIGYNQVVDIPSGSTLPRIQREDVLDIIIPRPSNEIQLYIGNKLRLAEKLRKEADELKIEAEQIVYKDLRLEWWESKFENNTNNIEIIDPLLFEERIDAQYYCNNFFKAYEDARSIGFFFIKFLDLAKLNTGFPNSEDKGKIPYFRISDFNDLLIDYNRVIHVDEYVYNAKKNSQLKIGDILFAITGATIGKTTVFDNENIEKATLSADTGYARFKSLNLAYYYLVYFRTKIGVAAIKRGETGITNKHLSVEYLQNLELPWNEQNRSEEVAVKLKKHIINNLKSKDLIASAMKDTEDLIEGKFVLPIKTGVQ